jgi:hypothetical protein
MRAGLEIAAAVEIMLVVLASIFPWARKVLPLGGSEIAQIGIVFGTMVVIFNLAAAFNWI